MTGTKEFYELMDQFERDVRQITYGHKVERYSRDANVPAGQFYQDGHVNELFRAYMYGYQLRRCQDNSERERDQFRTEMKEVIGWADYWYSLLMGSHEGDVTEHSLAEWVLFKERTAHFRQANNDITRGHNGTTAQMEEAA